MKCIISTNVSVGYKNMLHRGAQFKLRYIHAPTDTAEEVRDLRKFIGVVAEDARDLGYYVSYSKDQDEQTNRRHDRQDGHVPLSPREIALSARLNKAEQMARRLVEVNRRMRFVMLQAGISCAQFEAETALEV